MIATYLPSRGRSGKTYYIIDEVNFCNLWKGKVHMITGAGYAVHMEKYQEFNAILSEFLEEIWSSK